MNIVVRRSASEYNVVGGLTGRAVCFPPRGRLKLSRQGELLLSISLQSFWVICKFSICSLHPLWSQVNGVLSPGFFASFTKKINSGV